MRLAVGNSLIGARRQVFKAADLKRRNTRDESNWLGLVPEHVPLGPKWHDRPKNTVYHFLVPDLGMAAFDSDRVIRGLAPTEVKAIKDWRRDFCKPFDQAEVTKLIELSEAVDALWKQVISERRRAVEKTNQPIPVWGQNPPGEHSSNIPAQEKVVAELERYYTAYRRLKLAKDYWCALWFWPMPEAAKLPSRDVFLFDMELILKGTIQTPQPDAVLGQLFPGEPVNPEHVTFGHYGMVNVEDLLKKNERLRIVDQVAQKVRFHHWELRFAELFADRGGFDLIVGNPPWVLVSFDEAGVLSDQDPLVALRKMSATEVGKVRDGMLGHPTSLQAYLTEFVAQTGTQSFLGSQVKYPHLQGMKPNLYKCFITTAWEIGSADGMAGYLHPEGVYDDPSGFTVCGDCGVVRPPQATAPVRHRYWCYYNQQGRQEDWKPLFLYRQVESEAIRLLLPVSTFQAETKLATFKACLDLGLQKKFKGRPDHLIIREQQDPGTSGDSAPRRFLVLYDTVPGGTGYLKEFARNPEAMREVLEGAFRTLKSCRCRQEPGVDGCYRCVYAYQWQNELELVSREL